MNAKLPNHPTPEELIAYVEKAERIINKIRYGI